MSSIREGSTRHPKVIVVAGPTASGKSALGLAIADAFDGVIINADSQQRYADLRVLSARPSQEDEARAPHKLFGDLGPRDAGSAAEWAIKAAAEIQAATTANKLPILVGGTGLYFRALMEGLSDMPAIPAHVREGAQTLRDEIGAEAFHARLALRDPVLGARLNPADRQRVLRAWEVVEATGKPLSAWQATPGAPTLEAAYFSILMLPPRDALYAACDARFRAMVEGGALGEVRSLMDRGIDLGRGVGKALGVSHLADFLAGKADLEGSITLAQTATRQYAKRQMTWFRNQFNAQLTVKEKLSESLIREIFANIRRFLLT